VETNAILRPQKEEALIAFAYAQSISDELADSGVSYKADESMEDSLPNNNSSPHILRETAFVWSREDGTNALVQTWPTNLNEQFRKTFTISEGTNPAPEKFQPQAVSEFQEAMVRLFGPAAARCPVLFCHKKTVNTSPAVVGSSEEVLAHIKEHPTLMQELAILSIDSDGPGFTADGISGDGAKFEKHFTLTPAEQYVVYRKAGWDTMGCAKPLHQFIRDADLHEHPTLLKDTSEKLEPLYGSSFRSMPARAWEVCYSRFPSDSMFPAHGASQDTSAVPPGMHGDFRSAPPETWLNLHKRFVVMPVEQCETSTASALQEAAPQPGQSSHDMQFRECPREYWAALHSQFLEY